MSSNVKFVSYKSYIVGSWIFIHSTYLCLLIGMFNPFTLVVINGKVGFTCAILLIFFKYVLWLFVPLFPHIVAFYVKYFMLYYFNSLLFVFLLCIFLAVFLVAAFGINILICNNLLHINTNLISVIHKTLLLYSFIPFSLLCAVIFI